MANRGSLVHDSCIISVYCIYSFDLVVQSKCAEEIRVSANPWLINAKKHEGNVVSD